MLSLFQEAKDALTTQKLPFKEAFAALLRIGSSQEEIVKWGLRWSERPASSLTAEDWQALQSEIGALGSILIHEKSPFESTVKMVLAQSKSTTSTFFRQPTQDEARRFLDLIRRCVEDLLKYSSADVGPLEITVTVSRRDRLPVSREPRQKVPSMFDYALYRFLMALQQSGGLIGHCPECNHTFLAERTNQKYCSSRCHSRTTSRAHRQRKLATLKAKIKIRKRRSQRKHSRKEAR